MGAPEPLAYFSTLVGRALAAAKAAPALTEVVPLTDRGWRLCFDLSDRAGGRVELNALARADDPSRFDYSFVPASEGDARREHLDRVGLLLCRALGRLNPEAPAPALVRTPDDDDDDDETRERMNFWLGGECDRMCEFCSVSVQAPDKRERARLPMMPDISSSSFATIETELRANAHRADAIAVEWSGQDCLLSPDFDPGLRLAHSLGYRRMGIQTPGSRLVEPGFIEFLRAHSVARAGLTAHARDPEVFARSGGKDGAHAIFWQGLRGLLDAGIRVGVEVPITARTVDDLPEHLAELAAQPCSVSCFYWWPSEDMDHLFGDIGVPFERAIATLRRASERVEAGRIGIAGIPACARPADLLEHYCWSYADHMTHIEFDRAPTCEHCSVREDCPGAVPVYTRSHPWPQTPA